MNKKAFKLSTTLPTYFHDIAGSEPLSREREAELAIKIRQGDTQARDELATANLRFVVDIAREYRHRGLPLEDLIAIGNMGLLEATKRFDETKGFKFITYAVWWIRQAIKQTLSKKNREIYLPLAHQHFLGDLNETTRALEQELGKEPSLEQVTERLKLSSEKMKTMLQESVSTIPFEQPVDGNKDRTLGSLLSDTTQEPPDASVLRESFKNQIKQLMNCLNAQEKGIIELYFGLNGKESMTLEEIGSHLGRTRERVRQVKERALGKMRHPTRARVLKEDTDE